MNMSALLEQTPSSRDWYPSRNPGQRAAVIKRREPIVYGSDEQDAPLSATQISDYQRCGFLIIDEFFTTAEVANFQKELDQLRSDPKIQTLEQTITEPGSRDVRSIFAVHELSAVFARLMRDSRLVRIAQYLLGDSVYIHQSRLNYKPGFRGKEFYWHSDFETWHVEDGMPAMRALSMSITLTENHAVNGPLLLIPGSHKEFLVCEGETPAEHFKSSLKQQRYGVPDDANLARLAADQGITQFSSKPGSICLFDCNTMHGSNGNISPFPRSNLFFVYNALSNRVLSPYSGQPPRPEYICTREKITRISATDNKGVDDE